jgi:hypothetical protein
LRPDLHHGHQQHEVRHQRHHRFAHQELPQGLRDLLNQQIQTKEPQNDRISEKMIFFARAMKILKIECMLQIIFLHY